jgi:hypothetical protein
MTLEEDYSILPYNRSSVRSRMGSYSDSFFFAYWATICCWTLGGTIS